MEPEFKPGDIVVLKSGSPPMTVKNISDDGTKITTHWFPYASSGGWLYPCEAEFVLDTLKLKGEKE